MDPITVPLEILLIIVGGVVSLMFGVVLHNITKLSRRNEERYKERNEREYAMNRYFFAVGSLAITSGKVIKTLHTECDTQLDHDLKEAQTTKKTYYDKVDKWRIEQDGR